MARPNSPDMLPKRTKKVRLGINIILIVLTDIAAYYKNYFIITINVNFVCQGEILWGKGLQ